LIGNIPDILKNRKKTEMKKRKFRIFINLMLLLITFLSTMLISCSCESFGLILDGDGIVVVPNFRPSFGDETDWGESDRDTERETERETNKCSHEWALRSEYPEMLSCLDETDVMMECTKYHCYEVKTVTARGACRPDSNGICRYCAKRANDISNFTFRRRGDKYYEAYLKADCTDKTVIFPDHYLDLPVKLIGSDGPNGSVEQIFIGAGVSQLYSCAFLNFNNLVSVYVEEGSELKNIRDSAFSGCEKLTYIPLERCNNLTTIMDEAFKDCVSLESITLPTTVNNIRDGAFRGCTKLSDIRILGTHVKYDEYVFADCDALTDISFVELKYIPSGMFYGCDGIEYVEIPDTVT
jgi:hypothetical protein